MSISLIQNDALGKLILRLTLGTLMLFHGVAKILNPSSLKFIGKQLTTVSLPEMLAYGVYLGEIIAPLMIIFGIFTRIGGLLVAGTMVFAIVLVHSNELFSLTEHGGLALELQFFYLLMGLTVFLLGSGKIAVKPD